jgi:SAM-dependent methyltransferase
VVLVISRAERARSFGEVAEDYDRLRPSPPDAAVDWLLPDQAGIVADLAAGTGLLTRALARRVPRVVALEPDPRMSAVLHASSPAARVVRAVGEQLPLAAASTDGVFIQSAWHWLDPDRALPEIARVLRPGGTFGALWITRDREVDWVAELDQARRPAQPASVSPPVREAGRRARSRMIELPADTTFGKSENASFRYTRTMTVADFLGMLATYSRIITADPADVTADAGRARAYLAQRFPGATELDVPLHAWTWRARRG